MGTTDHQHFHFLEKTPLRLVTSLFFGTLLIAPVALYLVNRAATPKQLDIAPSDKRIATNISTDNHTQHSSSSQVNINSTSKIANGVQTTITINGQPHSVPHNGSVNKTIISGGNTTSISASNLSSQNSSTTNLSVSSSDVTGRDP